MADSTKELGRIIHERRRRVRLTLQKLSSMSGVSPSHLARIERRERFPSARILHKIAKPLNFEENELFTMAGYLSAPAAGRQDVHKDYTGGLDPQVVNLLAQEPFHMQRAVMEILNILHGVSEAPEKHYSTPFK